MDGAMGDMQGGIVAGWHDGIGKRVGAWTTATFGWLCVFHDWVSHPILALLLEPLARALCPFHEARIAPLLVKIGIRHR